MITFNLGNDSPKKDKQQDIKIADLQAAVDELNTEIESITAALGSLAQSIDDKYAAQTQTLMSALTSQINALSESLSSVVTTAQVNADYGNFERLSASILATIKEITAEVLTVTSRAHFEEADIAALSSTEATVRTLNATTAELANATIGLLNVTSFVISTLTATTLNASKVNAGEVESAEKVVTPLLKADNITGITWHTPIGTPDNAELLKITVPQYNGIIQLMTEDDELNISIINGEFVSYNQRAEYIYRLQRNENNTEIFLKNIGDTVDYRFVFIGSEDTVTATSEIVDKTGIRQNVTSLRGILQFETGNLELNILYVDYLPETGEDRNLYISETQGAWIWKEEEQKFVSFVGSDLIDAVSANTSHIGNMSDLETTAKTSLVAAMNEQETDINTLITSVGTLSNLTTDAKTNLVAAINEVDSHADTNSANIGTLSNLTTTVTADLVSAINEVDSHADTNASDISTIIGNDTGKSMREVAQEVSATVYTPQGSCTFANLPSLSASSTKVGFVYDVIDSFTTTSDFKEGAGIEVPAGTNIVVADVSGIKMWDLLGFNIDLSPYQKKVMNSSVSVAGTTQTTVEGAISALAAAMATIDSIYPVGTIYQNAAVDTNPSTLFGVGTWEKIEGKFLYGTATGISLGSTGGASTVTLGESNMPSHYHSTNIGSTTGSISGGLTTYAKNFNGATRPDGSRVYVDDALEANIYPGYASGPYFGHGDIANGNGTNGNYPPGGGRFVSADGHAGVVARNNAYNDVMGVYAGASGGLNGVDHYHFGFNHFHEINASITVNFGTKNTNSKGSGTAFSIIPPYVAVNIWKRTE